MLQMPTLMMVQLLLHVNATLNTVGTRIIVSACSVATGSSMSVDPRMDSGVYVSRMPYGQNEQRAVLFHVPRTLYQPRSISMTAANVRLILNGMSFKTSANAYKAIISKKEKDIVWSKGLPQLLLLLSVSLEQQESQE